MSELQLNKDFVLRKVCGVNVVLPAGLQVKDFGGALVLNDTGALIYEQLEAGKTAEEAAAREVQEELGLTLQSVTYAGTYWFDYNSQLMHGFIGCAKKAPLHLSTEVQSAKWVPAAEVPGVMLPDFPGNAAMTVFRQYITSRGLPMPDIQTMTPEQQKQMMRATKEKIGSK